MPPEGACTRLRLRIAACVPRCDLLAYARPMTLPRSICALLPGVLVCLCACTAQRTELGDIEPSGARVRSLDNYLDEYDSIASSETTPDGVPQTRINKRSKFQGKRYDMGGSPFEKKSFEDGGKEAAVRKIFDARGKTFGTKQWDGGFANSDYKHGMKPDFMNEDKGIARKDWQGEQREFERRAADESGLAYETAESAISTSQKDGIIEEGIQRGRSTKIRIVPYRDDQQRSVDDIRSLLGRKPGE